MSSVTESNLGLNYGWAYGESGWNTGMDDNLVKLGFTSRNQIKGILSSPSSDLLIPTLEFNNEAAGVIRLAQSFNDVTATTELAETVTTFMFCHCQDVDNKK